MRFEREAMTRLLRTACRPLILAVRTPPVRDAVAVIFFAVTLLAVAATVMEILR